MGTGEKVESHEDLGVYRLAHRAAMRLFSASKVFPPEARYSLTDRANSEKSPARSMTRSSANL